MAKSETKFCNELRKILKARNWFFFKVHGGPMQTAGMPDIYIAKNGYSAWVELKVGKNKTSALQRVKIKQLLDSGIDSFVLRLDEGEITLETGDGKAAEWYFTELVCVLEEEGWM